MTIQKNDAQNYSWDNVVDKAPNSTAEDSWGNLVARPVGNSDAKQSDSWDAWNVVPAENSQGTAQWKETTDSGNKD